MYVKLYTFRSFLLAGCKPLACLIDIPKYTHLKPALHPTKHIRRRGGCKSIFIRYVRIVLQAGFCGGRYPHVLNPFYRVIPAPHQVTVIIQSAAGAVLLYSFQYGKATLLHVFRGYVADPIIVDPLVLLIVMDGQISLACRRFKLL